MRPPKFNFVPEGQLVPKHGATEYTVSLLKNKQLYFSREVCEIYDLKDNFIKFYADTENKTVGWSIIQGNTNLSSINDSRKMTLTGKGMYKASISKILKALGAEITKTIKDMKVQKYVSTLHENDIYYIDMSEFIESKNPNLM